MTFQPGPRHPLPQVSVHPFSRHSSRLDALSAAANPASGAWPSANAALFIPLFFEDVITVQKAWWLNGATVGTDSADVGMYYMSDLSTGRLDLLRSTGALLSANANVVQASATWKVARTAITSGSDSTDATSYTTASVTLKAGRLYIMAVENSHGSSAAVVNGITSGPTFTSRATTQYNSNLNRVSIWSVVPAVDYTGTLVIEFGGGNTQTGACWALTEMSGVDTSTNDGIVQTAVGTGSSGTALATLAAFGSANNATFGAHGHAAATATAPGAGFTELADVTAATPAQALETEWRVDNDTTVDATFTSVAWGAVACEVKADASAFSVPAGTFYLGMACSGTTATFFRVAPNIAGSRLAGYLQAATSFPLPSTVTPVVATSAYIPMAGLSLRTLLD